jgi:hypothetical protein
LAECGFWRLVCTVVRENKSSLTTTGFDLP